MRKTFTLLFALCALCVSSWATPIQVGDFYYELYDRGIMVAELVKPTSGTYALAGAITIPGEINYGGTDYPVMGIYNDAFKDCTGITSVTIEDGVDYINPFAFENCSGLTTVTLPATLTSLNSQVFGFSGVTTIIVYATIPPTCESFYALDDMSSLAHIYVPSASVADYKAAYVWSNHASKIEAIPAEMIPTTATWDETDVQTVGIYAISAGESDSKTIDDITVTANSPATNDYCVFNYAYGSSYISISYGGKLTFAPASGKLTKIVISCNNEPTHPENRAAGSGWAWNPRTMKLIWKGDAATSVELACNGSSDGFYFRDIESIEFTYAAEEPVPVSTDITWDATNLDTVYVPSLGTQTIKEITVTNNADPGVGEYCHFMYQGAPMEYCNFSMSNGGSLTFAPAAGKKLTSIVINCADLMDVYMAADPNWEWDDVNKKLTWTGEATSVVLAGDGSSNSFSCGPISSIVFTVEEAPAPTPDPSFTWESRQINLVSINCDNTYNPTASTNVIKNIILTLAKTSDAEPYDYCYFSNELINILNNGTLTFQSIVGNLKSIVVTYDKTAYHNIDNLSADWTDDDVVGTLTWAGMPAELVSLSGNVELTVLSIVYTYTPAAAPYVGTQFWGDYEQKYEITGAHTAKIPVQSCNHTLNIPASVEYLGETYYVTEIADYAFYNQDDLPNVLHGENIARIGAHAFDGCIRMDEAMFESTVLESIGDEAFNNCLLMHVIQCPALVPPTIGSDVFTGNNFLNHIRVGDVDAYEVADGWSAYSAKLSTLWAGANIGERFFFHNQTTTNIYAVTSTDPREAKVMPYTDDVNAIYPRTLSSTLVIPEEAYYMYSTYQVTGIGPNAYKDSTCFNMVLIPQRVKLIEEGAFRNCTGVEKVFFLWDDPTTVTWADGALGQGKDFKTAASGETKIFVPEGTLAAYQAWAPAWASCMFEGELMDITATADPDHVGRYYRTFYDSSSDYMMPPSVWAHAGYVDGGNFILRPVAFDGQILPRGTAVVLESETQSYRLIPTGNDAPLYTGPNDLLGTDVQITRASLDADADKVYVLNKQATIGGNLQVGMGMYRYTGDNLGAHKAYMILNTSSGAPAPARFLFHREQTPTGVQNAQSDEASYTKILRDGQLIIMKDGKEYNAQGIIIK